MVGPQWWQMVRQVVGVARRSRRHMRRSRPGVEVLEGRLAPTVTLSISNPVPFPKPDTGQLMAMFAVTRSGELAPGLLVDYTTQDGTGVNGAHAGIDYVVTSGTLVFAPNQVVATITVPILGNNIFQADKTFTVSLSNQQPSIAFTVVPPVDTAVNPTCMAVGDFNGDGKPDLAIAALGISGSDLVSVLLNTTPPGATVPSFAPQTTFAIGFNPTSIAVGDFNSDGKPDLVISNSNFAGPAVASVLLNMTPTGAIVPSFVPQQTFAVGNLPGLVAVGDFNGDGKPDVAVTNAETNANNQGTVSVLRNTTPAGATTPSFAPPQTFTTGAFPLAVAVGDFNGDGRPDLAVTSGSPNAVAVLLNTTPMGASTLSFTPQQTFSTGQSPRTLAVGDFNGDGKPDLAVVNYFSETVSVLLNTTLAGATTPSFTPQQTLPTGYQAMSVAIGDINGDGRRDLAVADQSGRVSVFVNTTPAGATTLTFAPPQYVDNIGAGALLSLSVADFNGDGRLDLAGVGKPFSRMSVLVNTPVPITPTPSLAPPQTFSTDFSPDSVAVGDFNGDGKPDLAIANYGSNTVSVLLNTTPMGALSPSFALQQTFPVGRGPKSVAVGDFNGDGKPDLAVADFGANTVSVLLDTTSMGATTPNFSFQQPFAAGSYPDFLAVGDINGDGKADIAVASARSASLAVLVNTTAAGATTPSFTPQQTFPTVPYAGSVAVADFDGDGKPDLAIANANSVSVLLNTTVTGMTTPTFRPQQIFPTGGRSNFMAAADFNGDGRPDLVVTNYNSNAVAVLLNTTPVGTTVPSFAPPQTFSTGRLPLALAIGDFDRDGKPDLAVVNNGSDTISVLLNMTTTGSTTPNFAPQQAFPTGYYPESLAVGDFNSDGKPDLTVANFGDYTVSVFLNTTAPIMIVGSPATATISSAQQAPRNIFVVPGTTPQSAVVTTTFGTPLAVDVRDATGHFVQGVSVTFTASASGSGGLFGNSTSVTVLTNAAGRATAPAFVANTIAGSYMVMAQAAGGSNPITSFSLTNTPATASSFTLADLPDSVVAGTPSMLTVTARDPFNNVATGYTGMVHFSSTDPNASLPGDYTFTANDHGVHTFAGLVLLTAGTQFAIAYDVADGHINGVSPGVRVVAAAADHFAVTTSAADPEVAGNPFDVTVTVLDAYGNTVTDYTGTVTFSSGDPYGASLPADYTFQVGDQGTVTFSGESALYTAGTWDVTATDTQSGITGAAFVNVEAAPAGAFQVLAPASVASGTPFDVTVLAVDAYGNTDTNYQGTVHFSTTDPDPGVVLPPDYTFQPTDQGTATFPGGVTLMTPGDQTLTVIDTDSGIMGTTSITVSGPGDGAVARWRPEMRRWEAIGDAAFDGLIVVPGRRRGRGRAGEGPGFDPLE